MFCFIHLITIITTIVIINTQKNTIQLQIRHLIHPIESHPSTNVPSTEIKKSKNKSKNKDENEIII